MATVTKRELVVKISDETGLTQQLVFEVVRLTMDAISDALANGDSVVLRKFGAFQVKESKAKIGRNPKNPSKPVKIPPRATVRFKAANALKERVEPLLPKLREKARRADARKRSSAR